MFYPLTFMNDSLQIENMSAQNSSAQSPLVALLRQSKPEWFDEVFEAFGEITINIPREQIVEVCAFLKTAPGLEFNMLADLCGVAFDFQRASSAFESFTQ
ncbi:MAG: hypothetical protein NVSMB56_15400 [Pyrinomonadaceae bacterium]